MKLVIEFAHSLFYLMSTAFMYLGAYIWEHVPGSRY
jgi:hypothetical protein